MSDEQVNTDENITTDEVNNGAVKTDWTSTLSEDLRGSESISKYKSFEELAKGHVNLSKMIGKDKITKLGENPTEEEINDYHMALGRPESLEGYEFDFGDDEVIVDETRMSTFKETAFKLGLSAQQAQELAKMDIESQKAKQALSDTLREEAIGDVTKQMRAEMGQTFDGQMKNVESLVQKYFDKDAQAQLFNIETNPEIARGFAKMAKDMGSDTLVNGNINIGLTPSQAKSEIASLKSSDAYTNADNREHGATMTRVRELVEIAAGN